MTGHFKEKSDLDYREELKERREPPPLDKKFSNTQAELDQQQWQEAKTTEGFWRKDEEKKETSDKKNDNGDPGVFL